MGNILIGTSGYNYSDWVGNFYPDNLDKKDYLNYYSKTFSTVEINFTYYSLPNPFIFNNMAKKVSGNFIFCVKSNSSVTHKRDYKKEDIDRFINSLKPLIDKNRMGSVLLQFPWSFKFSDNNLDYLKKVKNDFYDKEICAEFRNNSWINDKTFKKMEELGIGFCNVDEPQINGLVPPTDINTTSIGYIRFHGRNESSWWNHKYAYQRYDYLYSRDELMKWVPKIKNVSNNTKKTYIYFNNHYKGKAVKSAGILIELLKDCNIITSQN